MLFITIKTQRRSKFVGKGEKVLNKIKTRFAIVVVFDSYLFNDFIIWRLL